MSKNISPGSSQTDITTSEEIEDILGRKRDDNDEQTRNAPDPYGINMVADTIFSIIRFAKDFIAYLRELPMHFKTRILTVPEPVFHEF